MLNKIFNFFRNLCANKAMFNTRLSLVTYFFAIIFIILIIKLITIIIVEEGGRLLNVKNNVIRKNITDRNGKLLATNLPISSLYAHPKDIIELDDSINKLKIIFAKYNQKINFDKLKKELSSGKKNFIWVKRDVSPQMEQEIYNLGLPGFNFTNEEKRIYIYDNLFSHVIGYINRENNGVCGVESYLNEYLKSSDNNEAVELSIDSNLQNILHEELNKTIKKFNAQGGGAVVVNPNNGEILAMVSLPDFNPNDRMHINSKNQFNMLNGGVYELGSIIKPLVVAIAIDSGAASPYDLYDLTKLQIYRKKLKDYTPQKGWKSIAEILLKSSNIGMSQIILSTPKDKLIDYYDKLGLLNRPKIELTGNAKPILPNLKKLDYLTWATLSYGYGMATTPLNIVQANVPMVNDGLFMPLTLIKNKNNNINPKRIFKKDTSIYMKKLLRLIVNKGSGKFANIPGYYIGGKTGTAEIAIKGGYDKNNRIASFISVMPSHAPKYLLYVVVNRPKGIKESYGFATGGWVGATTVKNIFYRIIALNAMKKINPKNPEIIKLNDIEYQVKE